MKNIKKFALLLALIASVSLSSCSSEQSLNKPDTTTSTAEENKKNKAAETQEKENTDKKEDKKDSDKKDDEIVLKPTEKQALINKQKELENTRNMKLLLVFAAFAVVVVAGGYVFYKKR